VKATLYWPNVGKLGMAPWMAHSSGWRADHCPQRDRNLFLSTENLTSRRALWAGDPVNREHACALNLFDLGRLQQS